MMHGSYNPLATSEDYSWRAGTETKVGALLDVQLLQMDEAGITELLDGKIWPLHMCISEVDVCDIAIASKLIEASDSEPSACHCKSSTVNGCFDNVHSVCER